MIFWGTLAFVKNYEKEKRSSDVKAVELQRSNSEKNRLFSIVSHDLRAPLTSIQSYLELLTDVDLALKDRRYLEKELLKHTLGTKEMLDNLLIWSKTQMEGVKVNVTSVDVLEVLQSTVELTAQISANKNILLTKSLPESLFILADRDMLQLIVRNLLSNAAKFTSENGKIHIAAFNENGKGIIEIRDNGIGIDAEKQKDIFSTNVNPTQGTNKEKGVGLGLILCKDYTELQGGNITFSSKPGEGTSFYISFPLSDEARSTKMPAA
jgi:signal transduction histidine kinase